MDKIDDLICNLPNAVIVPVTLNQSTDIGVQASPYEEYANQIEQVMKYKELVDLGIITEEEFQIKKKQIMEL